MAKTLDEIIVIARDTINSQNLPRFESSTGGKIRPETSSSPKYRAFAALVVKLCEENGVEIPEHVSEEEFMAQFSDEKSTERLGKWKRPEEVKKRLMQFVDDVSPESHYDKMTAEMFTHSQELSEVDKKFLYDSYILTLIAEHEKTKNCEKTYKPHSDKELAVVAEKFLTDQVQKESEIIHQPIPTKPADDKNRDIAVVIGAPGSGKSTFINSKIAEGYIHIDLDEIAIRLAAERNVSINDCGSEVYKEASAVAKLASALAFKRGYNIFIEKIGHSKDEVYKFTNEYKDLAKKCKMKPTSRLYCAHVSKEASTVRASGRTVQQIFEGEPLRYYRESDVYDKDNASIYTYFDILKDQLNGEHEEFEEMEIRVREGLKGDDEKLRSLGYNSESRERYKAQHRKIIPIPRRTPFVPQRNLAVAAAERGAF